MNCLDSAVVRENLTSITNGQSSQLACRQTENITLR